MVNQQLLLSLEPDIPQDLATWTVSGACYCCHGHCLWTILFILTRYLPILGPHHCSLPLFIALTTAEIIHTLGLDILSWHLELPPGRGSTFPVRYLGRANILICVYGWPPCILIIPRRYVCIACSGPCFPFKRWWCGFFLDLPVALLFAFWIASSPAVPPDTSRWMFSLRKIQSKSQ